MPKDNLAKKIEYGAIALFFAIAIVLSLRHIAAISSDIENGANIDPVKMTDFTRNGAYDKSSFILFSNTSSNEILSSDQNGLKIINLQDKYSSFLAQPVILQKDVKYKITLEYQMVGANGDLSATYGIVIGELIGKPIFSQSISKDKNNDSFEFTMSETTPIAFQYIRVLGEGQFVLRSIMLEESGGGNFTQPPSEQQTATPSSKEKSSPDAEDLLIIKNGWSAYGAREAIETKVFTQKNISVYQMEGEGWKVAKSTDKNSDFTIQKGRGVYLLNENGKQIELEESFIESNEKIVAGKNWNILFSEDKSRTNQLTFDLDGGQTNLDEALGESKIAKFAYLIDPQLSSNMTKIDLEKIKEIPSGNLIWFYVF
ncbi:MAG: hypothetical protein BWY43_00530 [candidate division WS2 bacterium ADurb.Bin280]|uniref:Uncharacterized protein n=1 Tax=candidate division WS2 bacterium ADurb.Bin280 TaxID=1852829 RepID=A0A1V5SDZ1_9BACT|nr:MAG: hypothetical protein BWY43_00530 [candidate division WS2 bacterium ADurb.Bin280]